MSDFPNSISAISKSSETGGFGFGLFGITSKSYFSGLSFYGFAF